MTEMKVSQYADNTILFLEEGLNSLNYSVRILKWPKKISCVAIDNKTKEAVDEKEGRNGV